MPKPVLALSLLLITLFIAACGGTAEPTAEALPTETMTPTPVPSLQASPLPTLQASVTAETEIEIVPTGTQVALDPLIGEEIPPPLTMSLPDGWQFGYDVRVFNDIGELRAVPFALYTGPVTGGTGFIVVLWDFPNATDANPFLQESIKPNLYVDGLRLLRLLILERDCVIGTDLQMEYSIAGRPADGTQFSTTACPQIPDTRGWFAGLFEQDIPFLFYVYTEPISAMDGTAQKELQAMLDSVTFTLVKQNS